MQLFIVILLFIGGLALIIWGGNLLVEGAENISNITGIPKVIIGATLVSFMTTLPEFMVTIFASASGAKDMAVGNATGSMFFNFLIIAGLIFLFRPTKLNKQDFLSKIILLFATTLTIFVFCIDKQISLINSIILLILFGVYIYISYYEAKKSLIQNNKTIEFKTKPKPKKSHIYNTIFLFILGGAMVAIGAKLMVDNGQLLGTLLGISSHIIGITIVSMGTSLPELVTGIISIRKNTTEISLGNILGSNVINGTLLLGTAGMLSDNVLSVKPDVCFIIMPILLLTIVLLGLSVLFKKKNTRIFGALMLSLAVAYYAYLFTTI